MAVMSFALVGQIAAGMEDATVVKTIVLPPIPSDVYVGASNDILLSNLPIFTTNPHWFYVNGYGNFYKVLSHYQL